MHTCLEHLVLATMARADATCICFKLLDIDHHGYLNWKELYVFAMIMIADFKGGPVWE